MPQDYYELHKLSVAELWWRVPLAFLAIVSPFAIFAWRFDTEGCEERASREDTLHLSPVPLRWLRVVVYCCATRFAWIYFATASSGAAYQISQVEALAWLLCVFGILPLWVVEELLCLQSTSKPDVGNGDAKTKVVLPRTL